MTIEYPAINMIINMFINIMVDVLLVQWIINGSSLG